MAEFVESKSVFLVSSDSEKFEVPIEIAEMSKYLKEMIDPTTEEAQEIPVTDVSTPILSKVIEFLKNHKLQPMNEIRKPLQSANMAEAVQEWYANFITVGVTQEVLFDLILAANYLDIKPLLELSCATVASLIDRKSPDEIRTLFGIEGEFVQVDEQQVREQNNWWEEEKKE
eukprot:gene22488-30749_t